MHSATPLYTRALLDTVGPFPEGTETGDDTLLSRRVLESGARIGFDAEIQLGHRELTRLHPYLRYHYARGRGLMYCVARHGFASPVGPAGQPVAAALSRIAALSPALRKVERAAPDPARRPDWVERYVAVSRQKWLAATCSEKPVRPRWRLRISVV